MAYNKKEEQKKFDDICDLIISGKSLRTALNKVKLSSSTFFLWLREDEFKSKQYARATVERAELMFEDMLDIADKYPKLTDTKFGTAIDTGDVQNKRVRIDTRKWALSKLNPKKYGEKIEPDDESDNEITVNRL